MNENIVILSNEFKDLLTEYVQAGADVKSNVRELAAKRATTLDCLNITADRLDIAHRKAFEIKRKDTSIQIAMHREDAEDYRSSAADSITEAKAQLVDMFSENIAVEILQKYIPTEAQGFYSEAASSISKAEFEEVNFRKPFIPVSESFEGQLNRLDLIEHMNPAQVATSYRGLLSGAKLGLIAPLREVSV